MYQSLRPATALLLLLCSASLLKAQSQSDIHAVGSTGTDNQIVWGTRFTDTSMQALPNTRSIWSLLQSQDPSTVTSHLDVGGLQTGVAALFGALGVSWTENQYRVNGFDITDPY